MVFGTLAPLKVTHHFPRFMKKIHKNICEWPMRGLCTHVRRRSDYLPYAYHRGPLPPPLQEFWRLIISDIATSFYRLSLGLQMPDIDQT